MVAALTLVGVLAAGALAYRRRTPGAHEALCNGLPAGSPAWDSSTRAVMGDAFAQTGVLRRRQLRLGGGDARSLRRRLGGRAIGGLLRDAPSR